MRKTPSASVLAVRDARRCPRARSAGADARSRRTPCAGSGRGRGPGPRGARPRRVPYSASASARWSGWISTGEGQRTRSGRISATAGRDGRRRARSGVAESSRSGSPPKRGRPRARGPRPPRGLLRRRAPYSRRRPPPRRPPGRSPSVAIQMRIASARPAFDARTSRPRRAISSSGCAPGRGSAPPASSLAPYGISELHRCIECGILVRCAEFIRSRHSDGSRQTS